MALLQAWTPRRSVAEGGGKWCQALQGSQATVAREVEGTELKTR